MSDKNELRGYITKSNLFEKCILGSGVSMVHLDQQDLQRLIGILQQFSEFEDEKSRRSFLPLVGLGLLLPRMDLAGPPFIASMKIVNFLGAYGRLPNGVEALGSLLDGIRVHLGMTEQSVINEIMAKYQLIPPTAQRDMSVGQPRLVDNAWSTPASNASFQADPRATRARKVIIIYSSADRQWLEMLKTQLALLERLRIVELWDDTRVMAGAREDQAMDEALDAASVALLLVSANFLASETIMDRKLPRILSRHAQGQLTLFPLILSHCLYMESPLGVYRGFNSADQPLSLLPLAQVEEVLVRLARELQRSI